MPQLNRVRPAIVSRATAPRRAHASSTEAAGTTAWATATAKAATAAATQRKSNAKHGAQQLDCHRARDVVGDRGMRPTSEARPMSARVATARQPLDRSR